MCRRSARSADLPAAPKPPAPSPHMRGGATANPSNSCATEADRLRVSLDDAAWLRLHRSDAEVTHDANNLENSHHTASRALRDRGRRRRRDLSRPGNSNDSYRVYKPLDEQDQKLSCSALRRNAGHAKDNLPKARPRRIEALSSRWGTLESTELRCNKPHMNTWTVKTVCEHSGASLSLSPSGPHKQSKTPASWTDDSQELRSVSACASAFVAPPSLFPSPSPFINLSVFNLRATALQSTRAPSARSHACRHEIT